MLRDEQQRVQSWERRGETVERLIERVVGDAGDQEAALSAIKLRPSFWNIDAHKRAMSMNLPGHILPWQSP